LILGTRFLKADFVHPDSPLTFKVALLEVPTAPLLYNIAQFIFRLIEGFKLVKTVRLSCPVGKVLSLVSWTHRLAVV
jgi:hypothetical protein